MYFNIYSSKTNTYIKNFAYDDLSKNIDLYKLKQIITRIELDFYNIYGSTDCVLCISNSEYSKDRED